MTLTTLNPGLDPIHVESGINTSITQNGASLCRHIPVTDVPSEKSSKWSTPLWAKNIIPNVVWIDGDIFSPAPSLLKLGYHQSVDAYYLLPTTRGLPKCSTLGYGLDQVRTLSFNKSQRPYAPISPSIVLLCFVTMFSHGPLIPLYYYPTPHFYSELVIQLSHTLCHRFLSRRSFPFE